MNKKQNKIKFVFLNDNRQSLATAIMTSQQGQSKQLKLIDEPLCDLSKESHINIMSLNSTDFTAWRGHITHIRGDQVTFLAEEQIDKNLRRHLRIPIEFDTYLYPVDSHKGRIPVKSFDISCGGIGISCEALLYPESEFDIVIPCTEPPLVVRTRILRSIGGYPMRYSCEFPNLLLQEEALIQESVFEHDLYQNRMRHN